MSNQTLYVHNVKSATTYQREASNGLRWTEHLIITIDGSSLTICLFPCGEVTASSVSSGDTSAGGEVVDV